MVKQKKRTRITQSGKNYAINCAIQGVRCEFRWSLTNQNAWFVTSFCTVLKINCTALNQNGEIFLCILLVCKAVILFPLRLVSYVTSTMDQRIDSVVCIKVLYMLILISSEIIHRNRGCSFLHRWAICQFICPTLTKFLNIFENGQKNF